ncbi:sensor histidine kinase [Jannaschia donghaensis]|uniref:histidine kinase n=1 Tax=Jannaschia donghaensis TaxID=420998 RepID=A0A0M6YDN0_9RHOB|nr:sensor histidine kinase [Jannaschia donghaensis]CTQ48090.1 putative sensor histidine kinase pdtaS [Jannaschia donghaensis]
MAAFLSVALLPIGLVAVMQTQELAEQSQSNAELALSALTEQAAAQERRTLARARGVGAAVAALIPDLRDDTDRCVAVLQDVLERTNNYSLIAFLPTSGLMTCSSSATSFDFSQFPTFADSMADPRPRVTVNTSGPVSGTSVIIVSMPVHDGPPESGTFLGYVTLSIPHLALDVMGWSEVDDAMVDLITFNEAGNVLTAGNGRLTADEHLPRDTDLSDLPDQGRTTFAAPDRMGIDRIYTVATIEPDQVYALGVWDRGRSLTRRSGGDIITSLFPALMWLAGLLVALVAVHRLVTQPLQVLGRQMALFTTARRLPVEDADNDPPTEIRRIQNAFHRMTEALIRDEASLENSVHEKSVLVKEIHHRVKNNLQLISSIINMQIREATSPEAKSALRQTQDRVLSMATIHRDLYQTNETGLVDVGHLISEVVGKTMEITPEMSDIDLRLDLDDVWLYPDQAVPMSLLASEAVINALKHMPTAQEAKRPRYLSIALSRAKDRLCIFHAENVAPDGPDAPDPARQSRGMGRKLIQAFATQLGGKVETRQADGAFALTVTFSASEFAPAPGTF